MAAGWYDWLRARLGWPAKPPPTLPGVWGLPDRRGRWEAPAYNGAWRGPDRAGLWGAAMHTGAWRVPARAAYWGLTGLIRTDFELFKGESAALQFTPPAAVDVTGWTLAVYVSRRAGERLAGSGDPLVTLTSDPAAGVTVTDAAAGAFRATLSSTQTRDTLGVGRFWYDVWRTDAGHEQVLAAGELNVVVPARW